MKNFCMDFYLTISTYCIQLKKIQCISKVCFCSLVLLHQHLNTHENNSEKNIIFCYANENCIWDQKWIASDVSNIKRKCNIFIKMKFWFEVLFLFVKTSLRSIYFLWTSSVKMLMIFKIKITRRHERLINILNYYIMYT